MEDAGIRRYLDHTCVQGAKPLSDYMGEVDVF